MRHSFLDKYAYQDTPVHRLDGRAKVIVLGATILAAVTTPVQAWWALAGYALLIACMISLARIPLLHVVTRWLVILPFILLAALSAPFLEGGRTVWSSSMLGLSVSEHGLHVAAGAIAGSTVSVLALITLVSVTPMPSLLEALRRLRVPAVFVMLLSFAYRYLFILVDEAERLETARESRSFGGGRLTHMRALGRMIASLLVRSFGRAERVYAAMLSRGYDASRPIPEAGRRFAGHDAAFLSAGLVLVIGLRSSVIWIPAMR